MHANSPACSANAPFAATRSLNGTFTTRSTNLRQPFVCGTATGRIAGARLLLRREDADHQRVMVTVVRALDLQDLRAAGEGAEIRHASSVASVPELPAPLRQPAALRQVLRDRERLFRRLREVRPLGHPALDGLHYLRCPWPITITPPLWRSTYSFPSMSHTCAPSPRRTCIGWGWPRLPRGGDAAGKEALGLLTVRASGRVSGRAPRSRARQLLDHSRSMSTVRAVPIAEETTPSDGSGAAGPTLTQGASWDPITSAAENRTRPRSRTRPRR